MNNTEQTTAADSLPDDDATAREAGDMAGEQLAPRRSPLTFQDVDGAIGLSDSRDKVVF